VSVYCRYVAVVLPAVTHVTGAVEGPGGHLEVSQLCQHVCCRHKWHLYAEGTCIVKRAREAVPAGTSPCRHVMMTVVKPQLV
jgi:hypothetical protein